MANDRALVQSLWVENGGLYENDSKFFNNPEHIQLFKQLIFGNWSLRNTFSNVWVIDKYGKWLLLIITANGGHLNIILTYVYCLSK